MGLLQNGQWVDQWYDTQAPDGEFRRQDSGFRSWVTPDDTAGPTASASPISNYLRELYQQPGVVQTVNFAHIK